MIQNRCVVTYKYAASLIALSLCVSGCGQSVTVTDSRERLWQQFGDQPVDKLLLDWGTPDAETLLTNGSRLLKYSFSTVYGAQTMGEYSRSCEASFLAESPKFIIMNVALEGSSTECSRLAQGERGVRRLPGVQPVGRFGYGHPWGYGSGISVGF